MLAGRLRITLLTRVGGAATRKLMVKGGCSSCQRDSHCFLKFILANCGKAVEEIWIGGMCNSQSDQNNLPQNARSYDRANYWMKLSRFVLKIFAASASVA